MSTYKTLPEPVHAGSLLANDDVYLARDVRSALAAQAEAHAADAKSEYERGRRQGLSDCYDDVRTASVERDALRAEVEALRPVLDAAYGMTFGEDWNKGTHAKAYRKKLINAVHVSRTVKW